MKTDPAEVERIARLIHEAFGAAMDVDADYLLSWVDVSQPVRDAYLAAARAVIADRLAGEFDATFGTTGEGP